MARVVTLEAEDDFDGWRAAARTLVAQRVHPAEVVWQVGSGPGDLFAAEAVVDEGAAPFMVPRAFGYMASRVVLHRDPERFSLLYALLLRVIENPRILQDRADRRLRRVEELFDTIRRDMHKMRAFVRFREVEAGGTKRFVAWFEPEHHIVRANAAFFVGRFTAMNWSILTPMASIHWDGKSVTEGPGASRADAPTDDPVEHVWKAYFRSIFNPSRLAPGAMMREMPKKYWKNMPEAALVPELIAGARSREIGMIDKARSAPRRDETTSIEALRDEAAGCRRCPLWGPATQTVFGEGPVDAEIMIVGEQPGDHEDMSGRPFAGPAGAVLDRALSAAGIDRTSVYVTNAVKHFKFEPRGKRRIHAKPNVAEIEACRWWVEQERAIVRPRLVIAMGATAARSILGRPVAIGTARSEPIAIDGGGLCWVTAHPSHVLRLPEGAHADNAFDRIVSDLVNARGFLDASLRASGITEPAQAEKISAS